MDTRLCGQSAWDGAGGLGWAARRIQLRGGDHVGLGWGALDIVVTEAPGPCALHLASKSVLPIRSQASVAT